MAALPASHSPQTSGASAAAVTGGLARRSNPFGEAHTTYTLEAMAVHVQKPLQALRAAILAEILDTKELEIAIDYLSQCGLNLTKEEQKVASLRKESADDGYYFQKDFGRDDAEALVKLIWDYGVWPTEITTVIDQTYMDESHALEQRDDVGTDLIMLRCKGARLPTSVMRFQRLETLVIISDTLICLPRVLAGLQNLKTLDLSACPKLEYIPDSVRVSVTLKLPLGSISRILT